MVTNIGWAEKYLAEIDSLDLFTYVFQNFYFDSRQSHQIFSKSFTQKLIKVLSFLIKLKRVSGPLM